MTQETQLNEIGFYVLAGAPRTPADLLPEMAQAEELGFGSAFISERYNIKEAATLSGAAAAVSRSGGDRHRSHQPQHPASAHHGFVRHDDAPTQRRAVHARAGARRRRRLRRLRPAEDHDRADGGHGGPAAPALARRGRDRARRSRRPIPAPAPRRVLRRGHPPRPGGVRAQHPVAGRPGLRHGRAAHLLHRRDHDPGGARPSAPQPRRRAGTRRRCGSGPATPRSPTPSPRTCA